eukprot:1431137-Prymnesium_polylepis.2
MFKGSDGYVLKPPEMCVAPNEGKLLMRSKREKDDDTYWPPARETLHCTDVAILSLHNLPKVRRLSIPLASWHESCALII